jgi:hypothetical protein
MRDSKIKPTKLWFVVDKRGDIEWDTCDKTWRGCIQQGFHCGPNLWKQYKKQGYRCVRLVVRDETRGRGK